MKKLRKILFALGLSFMLFLSACGPKNVQSTTKKLKIVAAIYPAYDWIKQIMGENFKNADVTFLLDKGVDMHSYQASIEDIAKIKEADLFIHVGGESDKWVKDALKDVSNKQQKVINMVETIGKKALEEEIVEGMQKEKEEDEHDKHEEAEIDEHVWLSISNAKILVQKIADSLVSLDPHNKDQYQKNTEKYLSSLSTLDQKYQALSKESKIKTLVFGDRFPFRYLTNAYNWKYFAAFVGCSAESEASFETITFLAKKVDELKLKNILVIDKSNQKIAKTIINNTKNKNQSILVLDSLQTSTSHDQNSYLEAMTKNLATLKKYFANE